MAFGYVYPAYECFKTVERRPLEIFQLLFWCHYWFVMPFLMLSACLSICFKLTTVSKHLIFCLFCRIIVALLTVFERVGDPLISWYTNVIRYLYSSMSSFFFRGLGLATCIMLMVCPSNLRRFCSTQG